jgi:hypothetical protein
MIVRTIRMGRGGRLLGGGRRDLSTSYYSINPTSGALRWIKLIADRL